MTSPGRGSGFLTRGKFPHGVQLPRRRDRLPFLLELIHWDWGQLVKIHRTSSLVLQWLGGPHRSVWGASSARVWHRGRGKAHGPVLQQGERGQRAQKDEHPTTSGLASATKPAPESTRWAKLRQLTRDRGTASSSARCENDWAGGFRCSGNELQVDLAHPRGRGSAWPDTRAREQQRRRSTCSELVFLPEAGKDHRQQREGSSISW